MMEGIVVRTVVLVFMLAAIYALYVLVHAPVDIVTN
jgi:hypothetical protein